MEETLGKRISSRRKAMGMTQDALAERLGITAQAVSKWENDQSCPDISMLPKLAEIFSCTTDELLGIAPKELTSTGPALESCEEAQPPSRRKRLSSPGAMFGFWLFLTGAVALIDAVRLPPYDLEDISLVHIGLCCGIFVYGLFGLLRRFSPLRLGCALAGGAFLYNLIAEPSIGDMDWYVPLLAGVALLGLDLFLDTLTGRKRAIPQGHWVPGCVKNNFSCEGESFNCTTSFGEERHRILLPTLSSGQAEVIFGSMTLDLTGCQDFAEGCHLELTSSFGELTVQLPRTCHAEVNARTAFAACETQGVPDPEAAARITITGSASFGHMMVQYI